MPSIIPDVEAYGCNGLVTWGRKWCSDHPAPRFILSPLNTTRIMACFSPLAIKNTKRMFNKDFYINYVPCGKCPGCLEARRSAWSFRLQQEEKISKESYFVTLTYNIDYIPINDKGNFTFNKKHLQDYFKKLRHDNPKLKYYAVAEYGGKFKRPHYHAIIYNCNADNIVEKWSEYDRKTEDYKSFGFVKIGPVTPADIHYVTGYIINDHSDLDKMDRPFSIMSKNLGKSFITEEIKNYYDKNREYTCIYPGGNRGTLPRYYRSHIFDENTRAAIASENQEKILKQMEDRPILSIIKERERKTYCVNRDKKNKT